MPRGEAMLMGFFLALAVAATLFALEFELPEARWFPLLVGTVTTALVLGYFVIKRSDKLSARFRAYIVDDLFMKIDAEAVGGAADDIDRSILRRERRLIALLAGFGLLAWLVGLTVAVPVFLLLIIRVFAGESWRTAAIVTGGTCLFLYLVFVEILRMRLHFGLLGGL